MAKLEGYSSVAVIKYGSCPYHFAIYDDGTDYQVGDTVVVSGLSNPGVISEIISVEDASARFNKSLTAEIICRVDTSAYEKRVAQRKEKEKLKKELEKRKREVQKIFDDEYYAGKDEIYASLLEKYKNL